MKYKRIQNFVNGSFVDASSSKVIAIISPIDGAVLSEMVCSTSADLDMAVAAAKAAFPA